MDTVRIGRGNTHLKKIVFGDSDKDYIVISPDSSTLFDAFVNGFKQIMNLADETDREINEIEAHEPNTEDGDIDKAIEISRANMNFSHKAVEIVDRIFGTGTVRKYFSDVYAEVPMFLPDADCILDFFDNIMPVMEETFNRKIEDSEKKRREKMNKYKPIDAAPDA